MGALPLKLSYTMPLIKFAKPLVLCGLAAISAIVSAQESFDYHAASVLLMESPRVLKDLGVTPAQQSKIDKAAAVSRSKMTAFRKEVEADAEKAREQGKKKMKVKDKRPALYKEVKKKLLAILTPAQVNRLGQLSLQGAGMIAVLDPVVSKRMEITVSQTKLLKASVDRGLAAAHRIETDAMAPIESKYGYQRPKNEETAREMQRNAQAEAKAAGQRIHPQIIAIQNQTRKQFEKILTSKQLSTWKQLCGKPIKSA